MLLDKGRFTKYGPKFAKLARSTLCSFHDRKDQNESVEAEQNENGGEDKTR